MFSQLQKDKKEVSNANIYALEEKIYAAIKDAVEDIITAVEKNGNRIHKAVAKPTENTWWRVCILLHFCSKI